MAAVLLNNRYQVLRELGRGGFGRTYLAIDTHMPSGQQCAIKQLKPLLTDPDRYDLACERFQREAAVLEALGRDSECIPCLYAYFAEANTFYLVQEWIDGPTLTQAVSDSGCLSPGEVRVLLEDLLGLLDFVHQRRIIHRDIKPDNVILRASDGKPVLIDFGIVKEAVDTLLDLDGSGTRSLSIGTPGYMAPEQAAGRPVYSSDLYSLGLTAVYALSDRSPQELETDPRTGEIAWRQVLPDLHSSLAGALDRCLRFHPRDRFSTAAEMLVSLRGGPVPIRATVPTSATALSAPATAAAPPTATAITDPTVATQVLPRPEPPPPRDRFWLVTGFLASGVVAAGLIAGYGLVRFSDALSQPTVNRRLEGQRSASVAPFELLPDSIAASKPEDTTEAESDTAIAPEPEPEPEPEATLPRQPPTVIVPTEPTPSPPAVRWFAEGTPEREIREALGEPAATTPGSLLGTDVVLYRDIATKADLGYVVDSSSRRLRQTNVHFAPNDSLEGIQAALTELLGGSLPPATANALRQVYAGETDRRQFASSRVAGMVHRNRGRLAVSFWDAN
ncbi:protein kinase domain protein [Rubidibacter lacunae KORDI 51-2]|uniref:non-specific serine/threonine protein kinase n=1 Tax=Rubidibacter lacunae KORDI 51-2 TaxID=582515 RepID=U5DLB0_9CHRO|nr:serine/threonine-protein kinase [Rubidibacter lacunae]ERN40505.1 protein kinase domain protein [Rubidibacter lacunae KORDI 51-2]